MPHQGGKLSRFVKLGSHEQFVYINLLITTEIIEELIMNVFDELFIRVSLILVGLIVVLLPFFA